MLLELTSPDLDRHLCSVCGIRYAKPHPLSGYYKTCGRCQNRNRRYLNARPLRPTRRPPWNGYRQKQRMLVIESLGAVCACPTCSTHPNAPCPVGHLPETAHLLTVEHTKNNGAHHRRFRIREGSEKRQRMGAPWERYLRVIRTQTDHGLLLLCFNCHHNVEWKKRLSASGEA